MKTIKRKRDLSPHYNISSNDILKSKKIKLFHDSMPKFEDATTTDKIFRKYTHIKRKMDRIICCENNQNVTETSETSRTSDEYDITKNKNLKRVKRESLTAKESTELMGICDKLYSCKIHDDDKEICNIYECCGSSNHDKCSKNGSANIISDKLRLVENCGNLSNMSEFGSVTAHYII